MKLIFDADHLVFVAAAAFEDRCVELTHKETGEKRLFKHKTKAAEHVDLSDYTIEDIQTAGDKTQAFALIKQMIKKAQVATGIDEYECILGGQPSWRIERSTLLRYKGNRVGGYRPLLLQDCRNYLISHHPTEVVASALEADDVCVMKAYGTDNVITGCDKDYRGTPVRYFDMNHPNDGILDCRCLGGLMLKGGRLSGKGRKFFYAQILIGDVADNYKPSCATKAKFGDVGAYKLLSPLKTDEECWQAIVDMYQKWYPEPLIVEGWRGDQFEIDWLYVLEEMVDLAHMVRFDGDRLVVKDVLQKMGVGV